MNATVALVISGVYRASETALASHRALTQQLNEASARADVFIVGEGPLDQERLRSAFGPQLRRLYEYGEADRRREEGVAHWAFKQWHKYRLAHYLVSEEEKTSRRHFAVIVMVRFETVFQFHSHTSAAAFLAEAVNNPDACWRQGPDGNFAGARAPMSVLLQAIGHLATCNVHATVSADALRGSTEKQRQFLAMEASVFSGLTVTPGTRSRLSSGLNAIQRALKMGGGLLADQPHHAWRNITCWSERLLANTVLKHSYKLLDFDQFASVREATDWERHLQVKCHELPCHGAPCGCRYDVWTWPDLDAKMWCQSGGPSTSIRVRANARAAQNISDSAVLHRLAAENCGVARGSPGVSVNFVRVAGRP